MQAAQQLLSGAGKAGAAEADVAAWVKVLEEDAAPYGPKIAAQTKTTVVNLLVNQEKYGKLAMPYALEAVNAKGLDKKGKYAALKLLQRAQTQAGLTGDAQGTMTQLTALDAELDKEYLETVPPFKPTKYAGRTDKSANKVAVMELFTGAQCPPCVAADVGFDALIKSYKPTEAIFLQYHEHIPGPDPLTNADTVGPLRLLRQEARQGLRRHPLVRVQRQAGGRRRRRHGEQREEVRRVRADPRQAARRDAPT